MTLNGIDVSAAGQGDSFNWNAWRGKIAFAGVKISEGLDFADPDAQRNIAGARSIGAVPVGYHFLHASLSGSGQAEHYLSCAKAAGLGQPGDLMAIDAEDLGLDEETPVQMGVTASAFAGEVRRHPRYVSYWPLLYTEISLAPAFSLLGNCPLWLANPSGMTVKAIGPWKQVSFEQTGQSGVDCDVFYGDLTALKKLAIPG